MDKLDIKILTTPPFSIIIILIVLAIVSFFGYWILVGFAKLNTSTNLLSFPMIFSSSDSTSAVSNFTALAILQTDNIMNSSGYTPFWITKNNTCLNAEKIVAFTNSVPPSSLEHLSALDEKAVINLLDSDYGVNYKYCG